MTSPASVPKCPECGAAYRLGANRCWLCGGQLPQGRDLPPRPVAAPPYAEVVDATLAARDTAGTFSLSSLFLVITLAAVAAGVAAAAPGLGVLFLVITMPALARTIIASWRQKRRGVATTSGAKVLDFVQSAVVMILILVCLVVALVVALFTVCAVGIADGALSGSGSEAGFFWGAVAGGLVALMGIAMILWTSWTIRKDRR